MSRILVVDDDQRMLRVVCMYLGMEGHEVASAADGEAALAELAQRAPEVIIMDIMMPGMDGIEACRRIRSDPAHVNIPVLLFSALSSEADVERARQAGASHLITKPFNLAGLAAMVRSFCPQPAVP